jgi:putative transposase
MPRKKKQPVSTPAVVLPKELLETLVPGPMAAKDLEAVFRQFKKAFMEQVLGAELAVHLDGPDSEAGGRNHRNGSSGKTVLTDAGAVRIDVPRDRAGTFEPQLIPKHQRLCRLRRQNRLDVRARHDRA